ncbi:MAG: guanylate kinase [Planctomycetaceae bacterium]|jgi:guanylate kinase|nr:guanylate kinase [Planctomycetaceae bacterium]
MSNGKLLVVSGPSGVGKGTLLREVFRSSSLPLVFSVSATTRKSRQGEQHGVDYFFMDKEEFERRRLNGEFLECFEVYKGGDWYGTLQSQVDKHLNAGNWVVLEIDVKGASEVKRIRQEAITIFIEPESREVLQERLRGRGSENEDSLKRRLEQAEAELTRAKEYDHRIVNSDLVLATKHFCDLLKRIANV